MPTTRTLEIDAPSALRMGAFLVGGLLLAAAGVYFVHYGRLNHDEGWYLYAARLILDGQLPYRDFAFYQSPLLPIVYALPQYLCEGIETGRWTSFAASAVTCALSLRLAMDRGGVVAVAFFVAGIVGAPLAVWTLVSTRTEPLSALFLVTAVFFLLRPTTRLRDDAFAVVAGVLAAATRISLVPAALLIVFWVVRRHGRKTSDLLRLLVPGLVIATGTGAVVLSGGVERAWLNLIEIQYLRHEQFDPPLQFDVADWFLSRIDFVGQLGSTFGIMMLVSCVCAVVFAAIWLTRRDRWSEGSRVAAAGPVAILIMIAWAPNLIPRGTYPVYFVAVLPLTLVVGGWGVAAVWERWLAAGNHRRGWVALGAVAGLALGLGQSLTFLAQRDGWVANSPSDLELLHTAANEVRARVPEESLLLTFDTYLAVEAGRRVPKGFEMGVFSWFPNRSAEDGRTLGLLTTDRLLSAFDSPDLGGVAVSDQGLGILITRSHFGYRPRRILQQDQITQAFPPLQRFRLDRTLPAFGQQRTALYLFVPKPGPTPNSAFSPVEQIVIIVVDTLRADHMGVYGYERHPTTPRFDAWAQSGRVFDWAFSTSSWTLPAMASLYTGQLPVRHRGGDIPGDRIRDRIPLAASSDGNGIGILSPLSPTLAERFQAAGYATGAIINNPFLSPIAEVEPGFDHYDFVANNERDGDAVVTAAIKWLDAQGNAPYFLVVHFIDPHMNYDPPADLRGRFTKGIKSSLSYPVERAELARKARNRSLADTSYLVGAYDEELLGIDSHLDRLLRDLTERGAMSDGLVLFTSDHGEELFDHRGFEHGHAMWQEVLRIPFVVWGAGVLPGRESTPVSLVDVAPTVAEAAALLKVGVVDGRSLLSTLRGGAAPQPRILAAEGILHGPQRSVAIRWPHKVVYVPGSRPTKMFDLSSDPREKVNLVGTQGELAASIVAEIESTLAPIRNAAVACREAGNCPSADGAASGARELPPEVRDGLRALGYTE